MVGEHVQFLPYLVLSMFLQRENEVGEGLSLIYPPEVVQAIRELYPADVCNYKPRSRKVS